MIIRGKVSVPNYGLAEVEFEIPDDSPEAAQLRQSILPGSYSVVPAIEPEECVNFHCYRTTPHTLTPECPVLPTEPSQPWKSGGGAGQWNG